MSLNYVCRFILIIHVYIYNYIYIYLHLCEMDITGILFTFILWYLEKSGHNYVQLTSDQQYIAAIVFSI